MAFIADFLTAQPLFALFITIALGFVLGSVSVKGLSLGAGAVLFVGLVVGAIAPKSALPPVIGSFGLLLFLYGVGIAYGAQFFQGLTSPLGIKANTAAFVAVLLTLIATLLAVKFIPGVSFAEALGAFAGAGTSTSALQAAMVVTGDKLPATGYSVAYPFGVAIPILIIGVYNSVIKPKYQKPERIALRVCAVRLENPEAVGHTMSYVNSLLPDGVSVTTAQRGGKSHGVGHLGDLQEGDIVLVSSVSGTLLDQAVPLLGTRLGDEISHVKGEHEYQRLFVSNPNLHGKTINEIRQMLKLNISVLHVRRVDTDMVVSQNLRLEIGDQIGVLVFSEQTGELQRFFGDSVRSGGDVAYLSMGVGVALGLAVGAIPLYLPGLGKFSLGFAGLLLVALFLGKQRSTGKFVWSMPFPANRVFRDFGLILFLANVGMVSGQTFVNTVAQSGLTYLLLGIALVSLLTVATLVFTVYVFRIPFDMAAGIVSGATGNPAIAAFSSRTLDSEKTDIGYAMIFPSMTIVKILMMQVVGAFM
ncbi:aspartate:alanine exchanger family transporter [Kingella negevensis]|uniref:Aspartate/alanine antiporter n=1 Tax=Kingella negevensis TaxID=1522312 RepID=A0A238TDV5_9NEIS|nr:aspartate:alanine antiporter [Kingella negevensis]MDK4680375.1 YidE/YbjL family protein [Kingella negevensis]MDK4681903.1 YidE/YbjL family protein [Kingella negevensis]MDK4685273.1 YidE/YbjL family protein [Kingella negevensis]MDK4689306.1 YidE/YbjL family protein [Kingella negevensis]MDK4690100.1 YidE/YbjL family protein [Kingella negevensis]